MSQVCAFTRYIIPKCLHLRNWSLITGKEATKWEGVQVKFYPYKKVGGGGGGAEKRLAMLKVGGHTKFRGSFNREA